MSLLSAIRRPQIRGYLTAVCQKQSTALVPYRALQKSYSTIATQQRKIQEQVTAHLHELNDLFLHSYGTRKAEVKRELGITCPVIILHRDNLILKHEGKTTNIKYVPDHYHLIKSIAHIACTIVDANLKTKEQCTAGLKSILKLCEKSKGVTNVEKYVPLLNKYLGLLEEEEITPVSLRCLEGSLKGLLKDAAILRTDALHEQIKLIQKQICPKAWDHLAVIVMGPRMPREGELGMQYAKKIILESTDASSAKVCPHLSNALTKTSHIFQGKRLIYVESVEDVDKALNELATEICDETLGETLLGDKAVMRADFLKDAVSEYLQTLTTKGGESV